MDVGRVKQQTGCVAESAELLQCRTAQEGGEGAHVHQRAAAASMTNRLLITQS